MLILHFIYFSSRLFQLFSFFEGVQLGIGSFFFFFGFDLLLIQLHNASTIFSMFISSLHFSSLFMHLQEFQQGIRTDEVFNPIITIFLSTLLHQCSSQGSEEKNLGENLGFGEMMFVNFYICGLVLFAPKPSIA